MNISITIEGTALLRANLATVQARLGGSGLNAALTAGGWLVANAAKPKAAFDTGTLRRSIRVEPGGPGVVYVGTDVAYARRIEYGFIGPDRLGRNYHQAARPYMRPAFDETKDAVRSEVINGIKDILRQS